jgi:transposase
MPWNVTDTVDERMRFVVAAQSGTLSMTVVCAGFGISRETCYKWLARYTDGGFAALSDGSRARRRQSTSMPEEITVLLLALREQRPRWGPKKLRGFLTRDRPDLSWPAASTIGDLLRREGLVTPRRARVVLSKSSRIRQRWRRTRSGASTSRVGSVPGTARGVIR